MCEFCGSEVCKCDRDDSNSVDMTQEDWQDFYSSLRDDYDDYDDYMDQDCSMNG